MALETQTKKIGGLSFRLSQLPAWTAFTAFHRFLAIAGPVLPALSTVFKSMSSKKPGEPLSAEAKQQVLEAIAVGLPEALMRCKPDELRELSETLLKPCVVIMGDGKSAQLPDVIDSVLTGRLPVLVQLVGWAVMVHFGSFISDLGMFGAPAVTEQSPSTSPKT